MADECTIYDATELQQQISDILEKKQAIDFDLSAVVCLDAAIVQLLISTKIELEASNLTFSISALSNNAQAYISAIHCDELCCKNSEDI